MHNELLVQFVQRVRWSTLCEQAMAYAEGRYAQLWSQLQHHATAQRREVAA